MYEKVRRGRGLTCSTYSEIGPFIVTPSHPMYRTQSPFYSVVTLYVLLSLWTQKFSHVGGNSRDGWSQPIILSTFSIKSCHLKMKTNWGSHFRNKKQKTSYALTFAILTYFFFTIWLIPKRLRMLLIVILESVSNFFNT